MSVDRRLLVLALGMFALGTDSFVVAGILPQLSRNFGVSIGAAGQMTTVYAIAYALLSPTIAALAASVERKRMLLLALTVFVLANVGTALAPTFGLALFSRAVAGLGAAMFAPTATGAATAIVSPERRGFALSVVVAGLTAATALGSPLGALIGGLSDWRQTMIFVAAIGVISMAGILRWLSEIPLPPKVSLAERVRPLADRRILLTLATTWLAMTAIFTLYTYFSVVFDRATAGSPLILGGLLVLWGTAGTITNLTTGRLLDRVGTHRVLMFMLTPLVLDFALMPWSSAHLATALPAILIFGTFGWGILVPQQFRLVSLAPTVAPVVLGLNTAFTYLGVTSAGLLGAAGIRLLGAHHLGWISAVLILAALGLARLATRCIEEPRP